MVHSAQRSSHASHGRQRKETEARDRVVAVGSLNIAAGVGVPEGSIMVISNEPRDGSARHLPVSMSGMRIEVVVVVVMSSDISRCAGRPAAGMNLVGDYIVVEVDR